MIVSAALRLPSGAILSLPRPARHGCIMRAFDDPEVIAKSDQGFLTSDGAFVNRQLARIIAFTSGQVSTVGGELFSEDLW